MRIRIKEIRYEYPKKDEKHMTHMNLIGHDGKVYKFLLEKKK